MKSETIPLLVPAELVEKLRATGKRTSLSMADVMRQSMKLGLPRLEESLSPLAGLEPFTAEQMRECYSKPNPDFDALEHHCAALQVRTEPFDE